MNTIDKKKYGELIKQRLPRVIETKEAHKEALKFVYELMQKGKQRTPEESALLKLFSVLISDYERKLNLFPVAEVEPIDVLKHLMELNNHTAKDLWTIADKTVISKVLNSERSISKSLAKALAEFYNVPSSLFI